MKGIAGADVEPLNQEPLARYEILRTLGGGAMGAVYLAQDSRLNRLVAVKRLRAELDGDAARTRFRKEARIIAGLNHQNLVSIYDFGEQDDVPFIVMEYVVGQSLKELIACRTLMPLSRKLELFEGICSGLAHVHERGIVHRDIKPANIMVTESGVAKVVDFGIARAPGTPLTGPGAAIGTPNYMAPEQVLGHGVDPRTDIFAVGAALYETVTYRLAFPGDAVEAAHRILSASPIRPGALSVDIDPDLERLIMRSLHRNPAQRFADMVHMQRELARVRRQLSGAEPSAHAVTLDPEATTVEAVAAPQSLVNPQDVDGSKRRVMIATAAVALAIVGVTFMFNGVAPREKPSRPLATENRATPPQLTAAEGLTASPPPNQRQYPQRSRRPAEASPSTAHQPGAPDAVPAVGREPVSAGTNTQPAATPNDPPANEALAGQSHPTEMASPAGKGPADVATSNQEISDVLKKYSDAYEAMDVAALKQVQPYLTVDDMRALSRNFLDLSSYRLQISELRITVQGLRARVDCTTTREMTPKEGLGRRVVDRAMINLEKRDNEWVITRIVGLQ